ncbi:MAG: type II secretion system protein [Candidatus Taylorbacteria bacterium]
MIRRLLIQKRSHLRNRGFTLVELMVTASIFVFMTALVVAKYGTFNQSVLLTNLAYDVALTVRTAQTYGLSVQGQTSGGGPLVFNSAYGIHFDTSNGTVMKLFADTNILDTPINPTDHVYDPLDTTVNTYNIKNGGSITSLCVSTGSGDCKTIFVSGNTTNVKKVSTLDISFKRPDPSAVICLGSNDCNYTSAQITITGPGTTQTRTVTVKKNGQITVDN